MPELLWRVLFLITGEKKEVRVGKIAIFIPVYNEAETLARLLSQVSPSILGRKTDIIVVDDASTDRSAEIAKRYAAHVSVLKKHSGVGAVTKAGLELISSYPDYEYVIKFDGDGQHDINLLTHVAGMLLEGNDAVICSRFHPLSDQTHTPIDRILLNMTFTGMLRKITGWKLTDVRTGFMGFRAELIRKIAPNLLVSGYGIPMELLLRVWHEKPDAKILEIPHPAMYNLGISQKLSDKYAGENLNDKASRVTEGFAALLAVVQDLNVPKEKILELNGFAAKRKLQPALEAVKAYLD